MGYDTVVIFGNPANYVSSGFKSCAKYNICLEGEVFPSAMLVRELKPGALDGRRWYYRDSPVYHFDKEQAEEFDKRFPFKEKAYQTSQEEFYIHSRSTLSSGE